MLRAKKIPYLLLAFFYLINLSASNHLSDLNLLIYPIKIKGGLNGKSMVMLLKQDKLQLDGVTVYGADSSYYSVKGWIKNDTVYLKETDEYGSSTCDFTGTITGFRFKGLAKPYNGNQESEFKFLLTKGNINTSQEAANVEVSNTDNAEEERRQSMRKLYRLLFFLILLVSVVVWLFLRFGDKFNRGSKQQKSADTLNTNDTSLDKSYNLVDDFLVRPQYTDFEKFAVELVLRDKQHFGIDERIDEEQLKRIRLTDHAFHSIKVNFVIGDDRYNFALICQYIEQIKKDEVFEIYDVGKMAEYAAYSKEEKLEVYFLIGTEGEERLPENLYLIPLKDLYSNRLSYLKLQKYKVTKGYEKFQYRPIMKELRLV